MGFERIREVLLGQVNGVIIILGLFRSGARKKFFLVSQTPKKALQILTHILEKGRLSTPKDITVCVEREIKVRIK